MLDGWSLSPQWSVGVLQQLSGTRRLSAPGVCLQAPSPQSAELLLPQHFSCAVKQMEREGAREREQEKSSFNLFSHGLVVSDDAMMHKLTCSETEKLCSKAVIVMILYDYKVQSCLKEFIHCIIIVKENCHRPRMWA